MVAFAVDPRTLYCFIMAPVAIFNAIYLTKLELSLLKYIKSGGGGVKVS